MLVSKEREREREREREEKKEKKEGRSLINVINRNSLGSGTRSRATTGSAY